VSATAECPRCGASGTMHCATPSGRDHRARTLAERGITPIGSTPAVARVVAEETLPDPVVEAAVAAEDEATRWDVKAPCLLDDMPAEVYHADPVPAWSLSSTGARVLWPQPGSPAKYLWQRDHPEPTRTVWDVGTALHAKVLGTHGGYFVPVDEHGVPYVRWDTNRCKALIAEIRATGSVPLKPDQAAMVDAMAEQILAHPDARALLAETAGAAEVSGFARDEGEGVWLRARYDWLPETDGGLLIIGDIKSAKDASDVGLQKAIGEHGYHRQGDWYVRVARLLQLAERIGFVIIGQEKDPPYLVNVVEPDVDAMRSAATLNDITVGVFAGCLESGVWPGYSDRVHSIALPGYVAAREQEAVNR
jgi:hypothetical protein